MEPQSERPSQQQLDNATLVDDCNDHEDEVDDALDRLDKDKDGKVQLFELRASLEAKHVPEDAVTALMEEFDVNKDGSLDHDEFERLLTVVSTSDKSTYGRKLKHWAHDLKHYRNLEAKS